MLTIDEGVLRPDGDDGEAAESTLLLGSFDVGLMRAALRRAGERCRDVDYLGREYGVDSVVDREIDESDSRDISHPHCKWYMVWPVADGSVSLYLDCQSSFTYEMGETFRRILREEVDGKSLAARATLRPDDEELEYVGDPDQG